MKIVRQKIAGAAVLLAASTVYAQTFTVTTSADSGTGSLRAALTAANAYGGAATVNLNAGLGTIDLASMLPVLENQYGITINGNGNTIDGGSTSATTGDRVFFIGVSSDVAAVSPSLTATTSTAWSISNLTIQNGNARGGSGAGGGGGGAGLGGGIFVNAGVLSLSGVTFSGNQAVGGSTATGLSLGSGGGMGGNGGVVGAGGGGFGIGANGTSQTNGAAGLFAGGASGGTGYEAARGYSGGTNGGAGGGSDGGEASGGGGVGGGNGSNLDGGNGGFGGGGGQGSEHGGNGGYGGGGGSSNFGPAGAGGFGGGGAVSFNSTSAGGFGAGAGTGSGNSASGGGGLGAGGAIFVRQGASIILVDGGFANDAVVGGTGGNNGQAIGSGLFLAGSATYSVSAGNTVTIADTIGGGTNSQITGGFTKAGGGTLILSGANSFTGGVTLAGGELSVAADANLGDAGNALTFNGGTLEVTGMAYTSTARTITWGTAGGGFDIGAAGNTFTVAQTLGNGGTLTKLGAGTLTLANTADNVGLGATVNAGTLVLAANSSSGVHAIGGGGLTINTGGTAQLAGTGGDQIYDSAPVALNSGGTFDLNGQTETIGALNGSAGSMLTNANTTAAGTLTVAGGGIYDGTFGTSGNGIGLVVGGQMLTLSGTTDNGYLSATVNGGTLVLGKTSSNSVHAVGGTLTVNSGATVQLAGSGGDQIYDGAAVALKGGTFDLNGQLETIGGLNGATGTITDTASGTSSALTVNGGGTFGGTIGDGSGSVSLVKAGSATLALTAVNTFTGGTTVRAGTLQLGDGTNPAALAGSAGATGNAAQNGRLGGTAVTVSAGATLVLLHNATVDGGNGGNGNAGAVGDGAAGSGGFGGVGGSGVNLAAGGILTNAGTIDGGNGGFSDLPAGNGADAVDFVAGGALFNTGAIAGGSGGSGPYSEYGVLGGAGVRFEAGGTLTNVGSIGGGTGGSGTKTNGAAGIGVQFTGAAGTLINQYGGTVNNGVAMDNYANNVTLQIGSSITGGLNVGASTASTLTLTDNGTGGSQTYSAAVAGGTTFAGSLFKTGTGTWVLDQPMTSTGNTEISDGTLSIAPGGSLASTAVTLDATAASSTLTLMGVTALGSDTNVSVINASLADIGLNYNGNLTVATLQIDGVFVLPGVYSAAAEPPADPTLFISAKGDLGTLTVVPEPSMSFIIALGLSPMLVRRRRSAGRSLRMIATIDANRAL